MRSVQAIAADPQPGDIYEGSWGYDQTNAEFWQVIKRTPSSVTLRKLALRVIDGRVIPSDKFHTESTGWVQGEDGEWFVDKTPVFVEKRCILGRKTHEAGHVGSRLKMKSYYSVYPWDGSAAYDTIAAGEPGH